MTITEPLPSKKKLFLSMFAVYFSVSMLVGCALQLSGVLKRQELQTINGRFEVRPWLMWSKAGLSRLNPLTLWKYHEDHKGNWNETLRWLVENNHPPVMNRIVIFNRMIEDEPPKEALESLPWIKPLLSFPLSRKTVGEMVEFLAKNGASAIILDNDFPQYTSEDKDLALAMHNCATGKFGRQVPVYMVKTVNKYRSGPILALEVPTSPEGILSELKVLEPNVDVTAKYTGMTTINEDDDQVARSINLVSPSAVGPDHESVIVKVLKQLGQKMRPDMPQRMDVDFASPPNSHLYPVRCLSYLLDPERKQRLMGHGAGGEVDVTGAIVFIGDGITDVWSTPFTNAELNRMSGTEVLAHALDTISRHSWPRRLDGWQSFLYLLVASIIGALFWVQWKDLQLSAWPTFKDQQKAALLRFAADVVFYALLIFGTYFVACVIFADYGLLVPIFVPGVALGMGAVAAIVWEREREKEEAFVERLKAAQEKLSLEKEKFESELARSQAEALTREMLSDRKRRHEFVRRINHDLNAPVSVLNWTIAELQMIDLSTPQARDKIARLVKSSDKLGELIDQLVQSYDYENVPGAKNIQAALCDLAEVVDDCVDGQKPLAEKYNDSLNWERPDGPLWVKANTLELSRVIDNIIRNAIKHNPRETCIFVTVESNATFHNIYIADSGKGIAPEHLPRLFEPGYRVNPEKRDGQGLGLDIAKTLIEAMGGEISVTSTAGKGTTFKLKLPFCKDDRAGLLEDLQAQTLEDQPALAKTLIMHSRELVKENEN